MGEAFDCPRCGAALDSDWRWCPSCGLSPQWMATRRGLIALGLFVVGFTLLYTVAA